MNNCHQPYDVVLLPPKDIAQEAIYLSKLIAEKFPVEFVLDGKTKYPHVTLYQLEIPDKNLDRVKNKLDRIFHKQKKITNQLTNFSNYETFISWDSHKTQNLYDLHQKVVDQLNVLRDGLKVSVVLEAFDSFTHQQKQELDKFGAIGVLQNFHPHITITRIKNLFDLGEVLSMLPVKKLTHVNFEKVALGKLSTHGTVVAILKEFNLT